MIKYSIIDWISAWAKIPTLFAHWHGEQYLSKRSITQKNKQTNCCAHTCCPRQSAVTFRRWDVEFEGEKPIATVRRDGMRPEEFPIIPSAAGVRGEGKPPESDTLQIQRSGTRYHRRSPSNPLDKRKNEKRLQSYRKGRRRIGPGGFSPKGASHQRNPLSLTDGDWGGFYRGVLQRAFLSSPSMWKAPSQGEMDSHNMNVIFGLVHFHFWGISLKIPSIWWAVICVDLFALHYHPQ